MDGSGSSRACAGLRPEVEETPARWAMAVSEREKGPAYPFGS
jgi:hypothetical protein